MPLHRFQRQYEQLSQFEKSRIIGMMQTGWSARQVARQLGRSDCVVRRCWHQWIREMSFPPRQVSGRPRQTSRSEEHHIVRNARVQPTTSSVTLQAQVAPSLGAPVSSRTIRRRLSEGHLGSRRLLRVLLLTSTHQRLRLEWCRSRGNWTAAEWNQFFSNGFRFNLSSDDNRVLVWRPRGERLNPAFAYMPQHIRNLITLKNRARKLYHNTLNPVYKTEANRLQERIKNSLKFTLNKFGTTGSKPLTH
ncbi:transposable element Tcb2 transposase [Trichonephila clavipes]|nr:transposable element Tcb2 transposase [Trichonephila clavipes]